MHKQIAFIKTLACTNLEEEDGNMTTKTKAGWNESKIDLDHYLQSGDVVDEALADYFLCVLPPVCHRSNLIQMGEPYSVVGGRFTYSTIEKTADGWVYRGHCYKGETINRTEDV
jgi:hypothetical protein